MKDTVPRIALFTPTQAEFAGPFRRLQLAHQSKDGILVVAAGRLYGVDTVLVRTGIGPKNAAFAADRIFEDFEVSEILVAGFGGATQSDLGPGDLVGCSEVINLTGDSGPSRIGSSSLLIERAQRTDRLSTVGPAATMARVISSAQEKQALGRKHGIAVVEMEGFPIMNVSRVHDVPALMVRAVLDTAEEELPDTTGLLSESGEPRFKKVVTHLAAHPGDAASFTNLRKRVKTCRIALSVFLEHYLLLRD